MDLEGEGEQFCNANEFKREKTGVLSGCCGVVLKTNCVVCTP